MLHFVQELEVSVGARKSFSHRVNGDVSAPPFTAPLDASSDSLRGLVEASDDDLPAELRRLAARLAQVCFQLLPPLHDPFARPIEDEAVAESRSTPKDSLGEASEPDGNSAGGPGINARTVDVIETALEGDQGRAPELAQQRYLLLLTLAARVEALPERLVLDVVPANADAEAEAPAGEQVEIGHLPRNEGGLALRQNQDARHELDALRERGQVSEHDERVVEGVLLGVRSGEFGLACLVRRTENMVVRQEIVEAQRLHACPDAAHRLRIAAKLYLGIDGADFHECLLTAAGARLVWPFDAEYSGILATDARLPKFNPTLRDGGWRIKPVPQNRAPLHDSSRHEFLVSSVGCADAAARMMDEGGNKAARQEIGMIKVAVPKMAQQVVDWAIQVFGGGGTGNDHFLGAAFATARLLRLADGPDEVHRNQIAQLELRRHRASDPFATGGSAAALTLEEADVRGRTGLWPAP